MRNSALDPCLTCRLPDCDDANPNCGLRRAIKDYYWYVRRKIDVPPDVRARKNLAYNELHGDQHRARSQEQKARFRAAREAERANPS